MNTDYIISKEGYRLEDLTYKNQRAIKAMRIIEAELDSFDYQRNGPT